jgi:lipopolysaccharide transport system permease protein
MTSVSEVRARFGLGQGWSPAALALRLVKHRFVLKQLAWRSIAGAYGGSIGGLLWIVVKPLLMLAVYTTVFGVVFHSRFYHDPSQDSAGAFALALFVGLTVFSVLAEMLGKAPTLIIGNITFVKRMVFPLDVLVASEFLATLFQFAVSMALFIVLLVVRTHGLPWAALATPFIVLPFLMFVLGLSWFLASLGTYLRDTAQVIGIVTSILMFLSPIFFPISALPQTAQDWIVLNPVAAVVEEMRNAFFLGTLPDPLVLLRHYVVGGLVMWLGWVWFEATRRGFADVL